MLSKLKKQVTQLIKKGPSKKLLYPVSFLFLLLLITTLIPVIYSGVFWGKIFPGTKIAEINVGGFSQQQATEKVKNNFDFPDKIRLVSDNQEFEVSSQIVELEYNIPASVSNAYYLYRTGDVLFDVKGRLLSFFEEPNIEFEYSVNQQGLNENLSVIAGQVSVEEVYPLVENQNGEIVVSRGQKGKKVNLQKLKSVIQKEISLAKNAPINIPVEEIDPTITDEEAESLKARAENFLGKSIVLEHEENSYTYDEAYLLNMLSLDGYNQQKIDELINDVSEKIDRNPQNAVFHYQDGVVQEFLPAKEGVVANKQELGSLIVEKLDEIETSSEEVASISIPIKTAQPEITTEEVNDLGITELIGRGTSTFTGSIPARIHNIALSSSKFDGVLVAPGETFSFNQTLGDVSSYTGYQQAYVIKDGQTVLGDGGGVCQVSTTLFRAILDAGLPIVERRAHSYRVGYYEQDSPPGLDATVYAPYTDLKFKNDTPGHILIQTITNTTNATLAFEIYGTDDGRVAEVTEPVITSQTPPPEDLYIDDPTLPQGEVKQIDYKAWGARVIFDYKVTKSGEAIHEKTFYSNYQPWQAKFLRGTGQI